MFFNKTLAKNLKKVYICTVKNLKKVYNWAKKNLKKVQMTS